MYSYIEIFQIIEEKKSIDINQKLNFDIDQMDESKMTLLSYAVHNNNPSVAQFLLLNGASIDIADNLGNTPLLEASLFGYFELVTLLIRHQANINHSNHVGETALSAAATNGYMNIIEILVDNGADINKADNFNTTPLMWALAHSRREIALFLIEKGALIDCRDEKGMHTLNYVSNLCDSYLIQLITQATQYDENMYKSFMQKIDDAYHTLQGILRKWGQAEK